MFKKGEGGSQGGNGGEAPCPPEVLGKDPEAVGERVGRGSVCSPGGEGEQKNSSVRGRHPVGVGLPDHLPEGRPHPLRSRMLVSQRPGMSP